MRNKFGAVRTEIDGISFASRREARRYQEIKLLFRAGEIEAIELQPEFPIVVNGIFVCKYIADFRYLDKKTGKLITEDAKGVRLPVYRIKKKLVKALYGVDVVEV